eukprot:GHVP01054030.1.p1 GENE.GHVP01054030.1~~GHVP01054030.1.p1  ORF type:complete len:424 (+),score=65.56 GHVP01054030.1:42-1313(+)
MAGKVVLSTGAMPGSLAPILPGLTTVERRRQQLLRKLFQTSKGRMIGTSLGPISPTATDQIDYANIQDNFRASVYEDTKDTKKFEFVPFVANWDSSKTEVVRQDTKHLGKYSETTSQAHVSSKLVSLKWFSSGDKLMLAEKNNISILDPYHKKVETTFRVPTSGALPHPKEAFLYAHIALGDTGTSYMRINDIRDKSTTLDKMSNHIISNIQAPYTPACAWSPNGNVIVLTDKSHHVKWLDIRKFDETYWSIDVSSMGNYSKELNCLKFDSTGNLLFLCNDQGNLEIVPAAQKSLEDPYSMRIHGADCIGIGVDPTGKYIATGGADRMVSLMCFPELSPLGSLSGIGGIVMEVGFNFDGSLVAWSSQQSERLLGRTSYSSSVTLGSVSPFEALWSNNMPSTSLHFLEWHPKRNLIAYAHALRR